MFVQCPARVQRKPDCLHSSMIAVKSVYKNACLGQRSCVEKAHSWGCLLREFLEKKGHLLDELQDGQLSVRKKVMAVMAAVIVAVVAVAVVKHNVERRCKHSLQLKFQLSDVGLTEHTHYKLQH